MIRKLLILTILFLNLYGNKLIVYYAKNSNGVCKFYEEKDYLTEISTFKGNCKNGFIEGKANIVYENGHKYIGNFHNGYYNGYGEFIWDKDNYIKGNFYRNYLTGHGESYNYGNVAQGEFYKNLFTGYGKFILRYGDTFIVNSGKDRLIISSILEDKALEEENQTKSLNLLKESLEIRLKYLKSHPLILDTYDNIIDVLLRRKNFKFLKEAKEYSLKSIKLKERIYNKNSETISTSYNNISMILFDLGEYIEAKEYMLKAIAIDEVRLSKDDPNLAYLYSNLSLIYRELGELKKAKKYLLKSLNIQGKIEKVDNIDLSIDYNTLSLIYQELGDLKMAKWYADKSLKINKKLDFKHPYVLKGSINLAMIYLDLKEYKTAKDIIENLLSVKDNIFQKNSYELSVLYNNASLMYKKTGNLDKAKFYGLEGLKISKNILEPNHQELATTYANISLLYMELKDIKKAKEYAIKALKIRKKNQNLSALSISYRDLAFIYIELKEYKKAVDYNLKSFKLYLKLRTFQSQLSSRAKKSVLKKDSIYIFNLLDMSLLINSDTVSKKVFNLWTKYKGEIINNQSYLMALKSKIDNSEISAKIDRLKDVKREYANFFMKKKANLLDLNDTNISLLKIKKDKLEEYLSSKIEDYKNSLKLKDINSSQISNILKSDEIYIDFAKTDRSYYQFIINKKGVINYYPLDVDSQNIDKLVKEYRKTIIKFGEIDNSDMKISEKKEKLKKINNKSKKLSKALYKILFKNIKLNYKRVIISPDGVLNLLPFEALYMDNGDYIMKNIEVKYVSSAKDLLRLNSLKKRGLDSGEITIFSNPSFDKNITSNYKKFKYSRDISELFSEYLFSLEDSRDAIFIKDIFKDKKDIKIVSFTEENASKINLFNIQKSPTILHISTHSLYAPDRDITLEEPLLKSAFALAGYNNNMENNFLGIVTALEFSNLNLYGTELVFFASCQSALGDIYSSEGVYGLNRASKLAGAKRVISTIWSVADKESAVLTKKFYINLKKHKDYIDSLRDSKLDMIKKGYHPFYWAGFIENGI